MPRILYAMAFPRISINQRIMAGAPCNRGTRIPVTTRSCSPTDEERRHLEAATRWYTSPYWEVVRELRHNVTAYDGWYVALAEQLDAAVATLDVRLANAAGPRCPFRTPPR